MLTAPRAAVRPAKVLNRSRFGLLLSLVIGLMGSTQGCFCDGCDGDEVAPIPLPKSCELDTECENAIDAYKFGECRLGGCESDAECCPGTRCRLDVNACVPHQLDPEYQCESDADCADPAQRCLEVRLGERAPLPACAYERCDADADCGSGRTCFLPGGDARGVCVETAPCGGGCPTGEVCDPLTSQCAKVPENASSIGCDQSCGETGLLVLANPDVMSGEVCCELVCRCRNLPPIVPSRFGRYADIAVANNEVLVSAYDSQFGDLVLAHFNKAGGLVQVEYVDGVPLGGAILASPNGPRQGVAEPGPDVGTHTSLGLDGRGRVRIAYHDVDNRSLKIALQRESSAFTTYTLDTPSDDEGAVGEYTDLAVDPQSGIIYVSYLVRDVAGAPGVTGRGSGVKLARSRTENPVGASDWEFTWVDARGAWDPCDGACSSTERCVLSGGAPTCAAEVTGCSDCSSTQFCVAGVGSGDAAGCAATAIAPTSSEFPKVRGLYTSLALRGGGAYLAYYDSIDGDLRMGQVSSSGTTSSWVIDGDGEVGHRSGDVGRFPALTTLGGELLVVYEDFTRHEVRAWQGIDPTSDGTFAVVDSGKAAGEPGKKFVGAGARIAIDSDDNPVVVYQDASNLDLKIARRNAQGWAPETVLTDGAHGFYAGIAVEGDQAFLVSVLAELDARGRERARASVTARSLP